MRKSPSKVKPRSGRKSKGSPEKAARIKAFRESRGWSYADLAEKLELTGPNAIYAWESHQYDPAPDTFIKLANLAEGSEWKYTKDFLRWAGVELKTMEQIADKLATERSSSTGNNVDVPSLESGSELMPFPSSLITNPASTRFLRLPYLESPLFSPGDIVLIDALVTDVRKLDDKALIAISIGKNKNIPFSIAIGTLVKQGKVFMFIGHDGKAMFLGDEADVGQHSPVLGTVFAWIRLSDGSINKLGQPLRSAGERAG